MSESEINHDLPALEEDQSFYQPAAGTDSDEVVIAEAFTDDAAAPEFLASLKAIIEAAIYITDEPLMPEQIAAAVAQPLERVRAILRELVTEYAAPDRGLSVRELAGGYKMSTKPEHHEAIRQFVKNLQPPLKLSLAALGDLGRGCLQAADYRA